jgi:hypothetical protein
MGGRVSHEPWMGLRGSNERCSSIGWTRNARLGSEDVTDTLDQQTSEIGVARLDDAQLRIVFARLTASWSQPEIAAHVTTSAEAFLIA